MTKKFKNTKCIYCLQESDNITTDHVFPRSWYPDTTPENMEKPQAPCCLQCNQHFSKIEQNLLERLAFGLEPGEACSLGIPERAINALNPKRAKSKRDREVRNNKRRKLMEEFKPAHTVFKKHIMPGLDHQYGYPMESLSALPFSVENLKALGEKFIRGIYFVLKQRYIPTNYRIEICFAKKEHSDELENLLKQYGAQYHSGPGLLIGIAMVPKDDMSGLYKITIWGKMFFYAFVYSCTVKNH